MRELVATISTEGSKKKTILDALVVHDPSKDVQSLARSEARVFLLYSTKKEGIQIIQQANNLGITKANYVWIVTQSVIGSDEYSLSAPKEFPVGMLGVHFSTDTQSMIEEIGPAMSVFGTALNTLSKKKDITMSEKISMIRSNISCHSPGDVRWSEGKLTQIREFSNILLELSKFYIVNYVFYLTFYAI